MPLAEYEPDHIASARDVYDHSVEQYVDAVGTTVSPDFEAPIDLAMLGSFARDILSDSVGPVLDAGCGPGRVTRFLADTGLDVSGIDISSGMIDAARSAHPHLRLDVGALTQLHRSDASLAGVVYWYSIIATPPEGLGAVWHELDRVLSATGRVLVAFQSGENDLVQRTNAYGSTSTLTLYRHRADDVAESLERAGFEVLVDVRRAAVFEHETTPQAMLLARRRDEG